MNNRKLKWLAVLFCVIMLLPSCSKKEEASYTDESINKMVTFVDVVPFGASHDEVFALKNEQAKAIFNQIEYDDYKGYPKDPTTFPHYLEYFSVWKLWDADEGNAIGNAYFEYYNDKLFSASYFCNLKPSEDREALSADQDVVVEALIEKAGEMGFVRQEDLTWWGGYEDIEGEKFLIEIDDGYPPERWITAFGAWEFGDYYTECEKDLIWFLSKDGKTVLAIAPMDILRGWGAQNRQYPAGGYRDEAQKDYYYGYVAVAQYDLEMAKEMFYELLPSDFGGMCYSLPYSVETVRAINEKGMTLVEFNELYREYYAGRGVEFYTPE